MSAQWVLVDRKVLNAVRLAYDVLPGLVTEDDQQVDRRAQKAADACRDALAISAMPRTEWDAMVKRAAEILYSCWTDDPFDWKRNPALVEQALAEAEAALRGALPGLKVEP